MKKTTKRLAAGGAKASKAVAHDKAKKSARQENLGDRWAGFATVDLGADLRAKANAFREQHGLSISEQCREALSAWLKSPEAKEAAKAKAAEKAAAKPEPKPKAEPKAKAAKKSDGKAKAAKLAAKPKNEAKPLGIPKSHSARKAAKAGADPKAVTAQAKADAAPAPTVQ
jgi:Arc/MetJ-type ribon-helix-helix transcriptional regulator